ncbi:MAG: hypothetical protein HC886_13240 [Leptolyngbyaceae cyanobacterium SM1_1_3]|nr:hypothetical protein [Leptolyngbyaceae cyanobacterium SM1_1_3]NJN02976.1 hypothetical protein [Leptolyngbyaceae cyanobacterium RM1_1_2]NJO10750.1 hypothetical protein [Leptolyngbyaceae cyanobacterium SL_1_1]
MPRLKLSLYLIPIFGFFPALWTLLLQQGDRREQSISKLSVVLALSWLSAYVLLGTGAAVSETAALRLLITSSLVGSGYFLVSLWLILRLWQGKSVKLPGLSQLSDRLP